MKRLFFCNIIEPATDTCTFVRDFLVPICTVPALAPIAHLSTHQFFQIFILQQSLRSQSSRPSANVQLPHRNVPELPPENIPHKFD